MMNRNFIFIFALLATFSLINAAPYQLRKRATQFQPCPLPDTATINVVMNPDPPVSEQPDTFTVSGKLNHDITEKKTEVIIGYVDPVAKQPIGEPYIQQFTAPIKAGNPFTITAKDVPTPKLPSTYVIGVVVGDPTDDPYAPLDAYGCTFGIVGGTTEEYPIADYPIASYPIAERS